MIERPTSTPSFGRRASAMAAPDRAVQAERLAADLVHQMEWTASSSTERPRDLMWFDRSQMLAISISVFHVILSLPTLQKVLEREGTLDAMGMGMSTFFSSLVTGFLIVIGLWFCTSRLRSRIARFLFTLIAAGTAWSNLSELIKPTDISLILPLSMRILAGIGATIGVIGVLFLYTPAARAWFARR